MVSVTVKRSGTSAVGSVYVGTTQDAIQQAVNYVGTQGGGSVFIEAGVYTISSSITLPSNIQLYGEGRHTVLRSAVGNNDEVISIEGSSTAFLRNISIHDLLIGNNQSASVGYIGIRIMYAEFISIRNCSFQYNSNYVLYIESSNNITINNNFFSNNYGSIYFEIVTKSKVRHNYIINQKNIPINLSNSKENKFDSNFLINNQSAIDVITNCSNNTFINNVIQNCNGSGFYVLGSSGNTFSGNVIQNCSLGIWMNNSSLDNLISNNIIKNHNEDAIWVDTSASRNAISGNFIANSEYATGFEEGCINNIVTSNIMINNASGLYIGSNNNTIVANIIKNNQIDNFDISGTGNNNQVNIIT